MECPTELPDCDAGYIETGMNTLTRYAHACAVEKGFYPADCPPQIGACIALIHSELSEALEAARNGNPISDSIWPYTNLAEELADAVIRIADLAEYCEVNLGGAILAKLDYNKTRPQKHGKEF